MRKAILSGVGSCFPEQIVTNQDLSKTLDTTDEWIRERTGITQRYIASEKETLAGLSASAARQAIEMANVDADAIDAIILATTSPDHLMPSTAVGVQALLKADRAFAFDVQAVCSGFLYALSIGDHFIRGGTCRNVLVIGADMMSRVVDWTDRSTCILFGDGAGAVVLKAEDTNENRGILTTRLYSDGNSYNMLYVDPAVTTPMGRGALKMQGRTVFTSAIAMMSASIRTVLQEQHLTIEQIDWFIAHQANKRIIDNVAQNLELPLEKVLMTIDQYANTSAATIPTTLDWAVRSNQVKAGDTLLFSAMGSGFTWGAGLATWK